ncbi:MAG TPA: hypothetical protein VI479_17310, partial [Blastocatellia bacterium]
LLFCAGVVDDIRQLKPYLVSALATPVLILAIPIFDTLVMAVTRKMSGCPVSRGGRDHTSHRLVALGGGERRATRLLYLFAAFLGGMALAVRQMAIWGAGADRGLLIECFVHRTLFGQSRSLRREQEFESTGRERNTDRSVRKPFAMANQQDR